MYWYEYAGLFLMGFGVLFDALGCLGLLRFPDVYNRLQAGTKCVTFGTCGILLGIFFYQGFSSASVRALLAIPFLLFTSPVGAHALARGAYRHKTKLWKDSVLDEYEAVASIDGEA